MKIKNLKLKINQNKPIQYIRGYVEFYKLRFRVTKDVLIPRPETELLVDEVLNCIKYYVSSIKGKDILILDVGTGAGNIAISIAKNAPAVKIIATDISKKALKVAQQNAKLHGVEDKIDFVESDLLSSVILRPEAEESLANASSEYSDIRQRSFAVAQDDNLIIVTNLPYIPSARISYLDSSVKDFEPHIALDGGEDGFDLYRKLFVRIARLKWQPKLIVGEIDYTHGELALSEAQKYFPEAQVEVKLDLAHKQRILLIR